MRSLPPAYHNLTTSLRGQPNLIVQMLISYLLQEETLMNASPPPALSMSQHLTPLSLNTFALTNAHFLLLASLPNKTTNLLISNASYVVGLATKPISAISGTLALLPTILILNFALNFPKTNPDPIDLHLSCKCWLPLLSPFLNR